MSEAAFLLIAPAGRLGADGRGGRRCSVRFDRLSSDEAAAVKQGRLKAMPVPAEVAGGALDDIVARVLGEPKT